jgi:hypothetical protein
MSISFFRVGRDAANEQNHDVLRAIADAGHEIGNHSFAHEPWLHLYSEEQLNHDIKSAEEAIQEATGVRPKGFRGPGFSLSTPLLQLLARRGYRYDASVFPNLLNPLARAYFFSTSRLSAEERRQRRALFGTWRDALRPVSAFRWNLAEGALLEIPVTTMPVVRLPFHLSYVIYLSRLSRSTAIAYWKFALGMCRRTGTVPSVLLHPLDFMGREDCTELDFFPGMDISRRRKVDLVMEMLDVLEAHFQPVTMATHAAVVADDEVLSVDRNRTNCNRYDSSDTRGRGTGCRCESGRGYDFVWP